MKSRKNDTTLMSLDMSRDIIGSYEDFIENIVKRIHLNVRIYSESKWVKKKVEHFFFFFKMSVTA